ncbi:MAG: hypothetical protein ACE144_17330 [Thermodesulfobacteriota bacterium]
MVRERLKRLAADERFIPGIYNYCDRWCERCPQTQRCLNFSMSEEESSDPETRDIRNEAFWKKLSETLQEAIEMLREEGKKRGIDLDSPASPSEVESIRKNDEAAKEHVISRASGSYAKMVDDWFKERDGLFFEMAAGAADEMDFAEALEVIRWYQYFVAAKVFRAIRGMKEEKEERDDEFPSDSDGSAKIALIAIDRSIGAWAVISHHDHRYAEEVLKMISFLDSLRQAVEQTFPKAKSFVRPGFDRIN